MGRHPEPRSLTRRLLAATVVAALVLAVPASGSAADVFPGSTRSHYLTGTSPGALAAAGRRDAVAAGAAGILDALVVLGGGEPDGGGHVRLPGTGRRASYDDLRDAAAAFGRAWQRVPVHPRLTLVVMAAAHGADVDAATGGAWGRMVGAVAKRVPGADVRGGLDVEVEWVAARQARAWVGGYLAATDRPFVDVGACTCPPYATVHGGWTLADLAAVADAGGRGSVLPQIYATAGGNAVEWATLARWAVRHSRPPLRFAGVLTEQAACTGPPVRACAGIDLGPRAAWRQLSAATGQQLRWATDIGYLDVPGAVHPSALRIVATALVALALAAVVSTLGLLAWRSRRGVHRPRRRKRRRRRRRRR